MEINNYPVEELKEIFENSKYESSDFEGKHILLLGGSGFLGSAFKAYFLYLNQEVFKTNPCFITSVDCYVGRNKPVEIVDKNLVHIEHDLSNPIEDKLDGKKIDFIINASGNASPATYSVYSLETIDISINGTIHLLRLARAHGAKILNFSSSEVLGTPPDDCVPTSEEQIPSIHSMNARTCYDGGKLLIENLTWIYRTRYGVDAKVVRLFNCTGRFRQEDFRVLPNFLSSILKNEKVNVFKPGTQTRTFSYYTDVIAGCIKVLTRSKDILYHVGSSDNEISMYDFALMVEKIAGKNGLVELVDTPDNYKHEPKRRCPSIKKISEELGFQPKISVDEIVRRVYDWAKVNYKY